MFIAHLPAGYLLSKATLRHHQTPGLLALGCVASIAPDFDLAWWYFIDNKQINHHEYLTHKPILWVSILSIGMIISGLTRNHWLGWASLLTGLGGLLHCLMDSWNSGIRWFWPISNTNYRLVDVAARFDPWWFNFLWHWSFVAELLILLAAGIVFVKQRRRGYWPSNTFNASPGEG